MNRSRRLLSHRWMPVALLVLVLSACAVEQRPPQPLYSPVIRASPLTAYSPIPTVPPALPTVKLTVLHTNDTWGYLAPCG